MAAVKNQKLTLLRSATKMEFDDPSDNVLDALLQSEEAETEIEKSVIQSALARKSH